MTNKEIKEIVEPICQWYQKNKRSMVWRDNPSPYFVWISEIMLQQTRIEAAKGYFNRFVAELPDIESLARVPEERLLKLWEGLGYYNRARNLQKTAQLLVERYDGQMPADYDILIQLPGIGPYTAGAISSIAFNQKAPAVDGNVLRVIMRYLASNADITKMSLRRKVEKDLMEVMPECPGDFNQGIMELGEVVCIPNGAPLCHQCPLSDRCKGRKTSNPEQFPYKPPKKERKICEYQVLIMEYNGQFLLQKRPEQGLLAKLWGFPMIEKDVDITTWLNKENFSFSSLEKWGKAKHIFSHVEWKMEGTHILLSSLDTKGIKAHDMVLVSPEQMQQEYSIPTAYRKFMESIMQI